MGGKSSKPELTRRKSLSSFGRSSQRILFEKSRNHLNKINKILKEYDKITAEALEEAKNSLDAVENQLSNVAECVKERNQRRYEDIWKYFEETREKYHRISSPTHQHVDRVREIPSETEEIHSEVEGSRVRILETPNQQEDSHRPSVEVKLLKVIGKVENGKAVESEEVELRPKPLDQIEEEEPKHASGVKFGVQVMPLLPRISQDLLRRRTLPLNSAPKAEFEKIRNASLGGFTSYINETDNSVENGNFDRFPHEEEHPKVLGEIETIAKYVDELEGKLKYFTGTKGDENYLELHQGFVKYLVKLDNIEIDGNPVLRQEKRILIQRIQELIKILEQLVEQTDEGEALENGSKDELLRNGNVERQESFNSDGKLISATSL